MEREQTSFKRRCLNPVFAARAALDATSKAIQAFERRMFDAPHFYPPAVRLAWRELPSPEEDGPHPKSVESPLIAMTGGLSLAVGILEYCGEPNWRQRFDDPEQSDSLHRWGWLLTSIATLNEPARISTATWLAESWLVASKALPDEVQTDPYSCSERIANFCVFWALQHPGHERDGAVQASPMIRSGLARMARHVADHLEYFQQETTGNHPLNNARALLCAGEFLGSPQLSSLAKAIVVERLAVLITPDGFLRDGSSHYHFLIARWLLEMAWVAECFGNTEMAACLAPVMPAVLDKCRFFLVSGPGGRGWSMPLMGDVSPDFPPHWLVALPWSGLALRWSDGPAAPEVPEPAGWAGLWLTERRSGGSTNAVPVAVAQSFPNSSWYRVDRGIFTMFCRAECETGRRYASHRHGDLTSFVLFCRGEPLIVDCGRWSYQYDDPLGCYGLSAASHNALCIDGLEPRAPYRFTRLPAFYTRVNVRVDVEELADETVLVLNHDGFARSRSGIGLHKRSIGIGRNQVWIEDVVQCSGRHEVETRFHWAPGAVVRKSSSGCDSALVIDRNGWQANWQAQFVGSEGVTLAVAREQVDPFPAGWMFPTYGTRIPCCTAIYRGSCQDGWRARFEIKLTD